MPLKAQIRRIKLNDSNQAQGDSKFLFEMVNERYGDRLTPEELEEVKKGIDAIQNMAGILRAVKLENNDEPLTLFVPHRKKG